MKWAWLTFFFLGAAVILSYPVEPKDPELELEWAKHKKKYNLDYSGEAEEYLKRSFNLTMIYVRSHNLLYERGLRGYKLELNYYAELVPHSHHYGVNRFMEHTTNVNKSVFVSKWNVSDLPKEVDWRNKGVVSKVGKQFQCASCYAFASAAVIESHMAIKTGKLVPLSVQNIVDCSDSARCTGGMITLSYDYVIGNNGIDTAESYPYVDENQKCKFRNDSIGATLSGYVEIPRDERLLMEAVATVGPVATAMDMGGNFDFLLYGEGIYDNPLCDSEVGHSVLIVGYGSENGKDYWIVKNSFGEDWGENGYMKIARNKNQCSIGTDASYPLVL